MAADPMSDSGPLSSDLEGPDSLLPDEDQVELNPDAASVEGEAGDDVEADNPAQRRFVVRRDHRARLDVYLQNRLKNISRTRIQKLINLGGITINNKAPKASSRLRQGDVVDVILPPQALREILPEPIPLHVLYEDPHFIVLNKQAGLVVHPARSHLSGTLLNGLAQRFKDQVEAQGGSYRAPTTRGFQPPRSAAADQPLGIEGLSSVGVQEFRPGIIHRLDKNTTGVIVVGKSDEAHWGIARQFEDRSTLKAYLALVHGNFDSVGGAVDQPLGKHPTIREACAIRNDSSGRRALTLFRVREQYRGYCLVELELKTGRTHQIRVHMAHLGHPIVGDILYGGEAVGQLELDQPPTLRVRAFVPFARDKVQGQRIEEEALQRPDLILAHPALHAALLRFVHPITRQPMTFTAPLHEPMAGLVQALRSRRIQAPESEQGYWVDLQQAVG